MKKKLGMIILGITICVIATGCGSKSNSSKKDDDTTKQIVQTNIETEKNNQSTNETTKVSETTKANQENSTKEVQNQTNKTPAQKEYLSTLDEVDEGIAFGTAGSSLSVVRQTASLMNLSVGTTLTKEQVKTETQYWLDNKDEQTKKEFIRKLEAIDAMYKQLLTDGQQELLDSAGCDYAAYPWSHEPLEVMEALMEVGGLR